MKDINKEIKNAELELKEILNNGIDELFSGNNKPLTNEDLKNARFDIVDIKIADIISKDEIVINSSEGKQLVVPVYLDENLQ